MPYAEVIGDPIAHSKSPLIHRFWLGKLGIAGEYRAKHMPAEEMSEFLEARRRDDDWRGCNVTIPHKEAARRMVDYLGAGETDLGAINTIVRHTNGTLVGYNTDVVGVVGPFNAYLDDRHGIGRPHPKFAVGIIGAGGAARAALHAFTSLSTTSSITILARRVEQAEEMLERLKPDSRFPLHIKPIETNSLEGIDVLVNASPLGMIGKPPLTLSLAALNDAHPLVFDMIYAPLRTKLLEEAVARRIDRIDGLEMLIGQADAAFHHFFGDRPPREHDAELRALLTA